MEKRARLQHFQGLQPDSFAKAIVEQVVGDKQHEAFQRIIGLANNHQFEDPREKPTSEFYRDDLAMVAQTVSNKLEDDAARAACMSLTDLITAVAQSNSYQTVNAIESVLRTLSPYKADHPEGNRVGEGPLRDFRNFAWILQGLDPDMVYAGYREVELNPEPAKALLKRGGSSYAEVVRILRSLEKKKVRVPQKGEDRSVFGRAMAGARQQVVDLCTQGKLGPFETRLTCIMLDGLAQV